MRLVTLTTITTVPQARVLAASLKRHHPGWRHDLVLIASRKVSAGTGSISLEAAAPELDFDLETLIACNDEQDLIAMVLPRFLKVYAKSCGEPVMHLPPTAWVTGDLQPVVQALPRRGLLLVPRTLGDPPDDGLEPSLDALERVGRVSDTAMAVDGGQLADGFLDWWGDRVEKMLGALTGAPGRGRPEDRPWLARALELAPARFGATLLDDPGCNVSMWNLHGRTLEQTSAGTMVDGHWPLRFMDLDGFQAEHPYRLSSNASRVRVSRSNALRALCAAYAGELEKAGWDATSELRDVGRRLANGLIYDDTLRLLHGRAMALGEHFSDLFGEHGSHAFTRWLEGPAPRGAAYGITRYVFYRILGERPDVMRAYPDLDGPDGREYVAWCWAFGQHEMGIPERFMPPRTGQLPDASSAQVTQGVVASDGTEHTDADRRRPVESEHDAVGDRNQQQGDVTCLSVRVSGYLRHTLGLGSAARGYARALSAVGVPTSTVSIALDHLALPPMLDDEYGRHEFEDLVHDGRHGFELIAVNADELPAFVERVGEDYFQGPRIGIWGWETNSIPARWQRAFALVDEIWVYSRFMAENIGNATTVPVVALPPPVQPPAQTVEPLRLGVPDGFLFLFVFDYLSTIQRKNPVGLIEAFKRAFAAGEGPQLLIKTINAPLRPLAEEALLWSADERPDIHVIDRSLTSPERDALMAACDCYVSLHRSEGFGLTMAEAMAIGKPVIGTAYSGNLDFMNAANSLLVDYELRLVGAECEIYPADGEWAEPSIEHAAQLMRDVYERPELAAQIAERARRDIAARLSTETTGEAMLRRLQELDALT